MVRWSPRTRNHEIGEELGLGLVLNPNTPSFHERPEIGKFDAAELIATAAHHDMAVLIEVEGGVCIAPAVPAELRRRWRRWRRQLRQKRLQTR